MNKLFTLLAGCLFLTAPFSYAQVDMSEFTKAERQGKKIDLGTVPKDVNYSWYLGKIARLIAAQMNNDSFQQAFFDEDSLSPQSLDDGEPTIDLLPFINTYRENADDSPLEVMSVQEDDQLQKLTKYISELQELIVETHDWDEDLVEGKELIKAKVFMPNIAPQSLADTSVSVIYPDEGAWSAGAEDESLQLQSSRGEPQIIGINQNGSKEVLTYDTQSESFGQKVVGIAPDDSTLMLIDIADFNRKISSGTKKAKVVEQFLSSSTTLSPQSAATKDDLYRIQHRDKACVDGQFVRYDSPFFHDRSACNRYCKYDKKFIPRLKINNLYSIEIKDIQTGFFDRLWGGAEVFMIALPGILNAQYLKDILVDYKGDPKDPFAIAIALPGVKNEDTKYTEKTFGFTPVIQWTTPRRRPSVMPAVMGLIIYEYDSKISSLFQTLLSAAADRIVFPGAGSAVYTFIELFNKYAAGKDVIDFYAAIYENNYWHLQNRNNWDQGALYYRGAANNAVIQLQTLCHSADSSLID